MIHMGGIIGVIISQGRVRRLIRCAPGWLRVRLETAALTFRNARDRRDFMAAGVAGGVAAAFGAPVGGLLFVAEELATHWDVSLGMQVGRAHVGSTRAATFALHRAVPAQILPLLLLLPFSWRSPGVFLRDRGVFDEPAAERNLSRPLLGGHSNRDRPR